MSLSSRKPLAVLVVSILLLALTTVGARGNPPLQEPAPPSTSSILTQLGTSASAPLSTTFTYQGNLTDNGSPANGEYDFRFILYDAAVGGSQVGPVETVGNLNVAEGLFTASLDFGAAFTGTAVWLEIGVRPGTGGGAYTILSPRQPLTAAPYALGLLPGATITGADPFGILNLVNTTGDGLYVDSAGDNGVHIEHTDGDGIFICATGTESSCTPHASNNGLEIGNAEGDGLRVNTTALNGVRVNSAAFDGVIVGTAGADGFQVNSAGIDGLRVVAASDDGVSIEFAGDNGVEVDNADNNGIQIEAAGNDGLKIFGAGNHGIEIDDATNNGIQIDHADGDGIFICATGTETSCTPSDANNGVEIGTTEGHGVRVFSTGGDGVLVAFAEDDGVDVYGNNLAGFFSGNIQVTGSCTGCLLAAFGVNTGSETLQPGDLVSVQGTQIIANDSVPMLMEIAKAKEGQTVIGVVGGWAELVTEEDPRPTEIGLRLIPRKGPVEPGGYVTIIYNGPVQVKASALDGSITAGARLTVGKNGGVRTLQTTEVNGITIAESAPVVGIALSEPDADGLVWVLVNPQ